MKFTSKGAVLAGTGDSQAPPPAAPGRSGPLRALLASPALWVALAAAASAIHFAAGPQVRAGVLYIVPIALAAWYGPIWAALLIAVGLSAGEAAYVTLEAWGPAETNEPTGVNLVLQTGARVLVALLIHRARQAKELERELAALRGMLPICLYCKQIRDDDGQWHTVEQYIGARSGAAFTHQVCPVCDGDHRRAFLGG